MIVAIDGPAGSGKSTVAHAIAGRCGLTFLDTGAMYRSVTLLCLRAGVDVSDAKAVASVEKDCSILFGSSASGQTVIVNGEDVTDQIRTPEVDRNVSAVSAVPAVRAALVDRQRQIAGSGDVVAEGRDIGTVVFPDAEVKVFLTADAKARAHRRAVQREGGDAARDASAAADAAQEARILEDLRRRDQLDSTRKESPLRPADDAVVIDSSDLTLEQVIQRVVDLMEAARAKASSAPKANLAPDGASKSAAKPNRSGSGGSRHVSKRGGAPSGRLHAFRGNAYGDYYDHAMREYPLPARALLGFVVCLLGLLTKILWPWHIEGSDGLWDGEHGRVIVMNHVSMLEPIIVVVSAWFHGRRIRPIYKSEFDKIAPATWLFSRVGGIPVARGTADLKAVRRAQWALERGEDVLIYPEGTRVKSDDEPVTIHGGFALIAQMAKAPVQPVAIVGARDITPRGEHLKRLGRVFVRAGEPIEFSSLGVRGRKQQCAQMERVAMERVYAIRDDLRREHPGKM